MQTWKLLLPAAAVLVSLALTIPAVSADPVTQSQIAAAKTSADHETIAAAYEAEAVAADARAQSHATMARTYRLGGAPKGDRSSMAAHCERLMQHYQSAAADYRSLAAEHRRLAAAAATQ